MVRTGVVLAVVIVAGVVGWSGLLTRADAVEESRASAQRWAQLQTARTTLLTADLAAAREVSLLGSGRLQASSGNSTDPAVARYAPQYGKQVERARTVAASGDPFVAGNVMQNASDQLRVQVLPRLEQAPDTSARAGAGIPLTGLMVVLLVTAVVAGVYARRAFRTRHVLDVSLASVAVVLLFVLVLGLGSVFSGLGADRDVRAGPQSAATRLAEGRNAAFDARSIEVDAEVVIPTVASVQADWQSAIGRAEAVLPDSSLDGYREAHERLLEKMKTEYGSSITDFILTRADGTAGAFARFDTATSAALDREVRASDDGWGAALGHLRLITWALLAAALITAVLVMPLARRGPRPH
jgi:hypothetical protein